MCQRMKLYCTNWVCITSKELHMENRVHEKKLRMINSWMELKSSINLEYENYAFIMSHFDRGNWKFYSLLGHICVGFYDGTKAFHHFLVVIVRCFANIQCTQIVCNVFNEVNEKPTWSNQKAYDWSDA